MNSPNEYTQTDEGYWQALFAEDAAHFGGATKAQPNNDRRSRPRKAELSHPTPDHAHARHALDDQTRSLLWRLKPGDTCEGEVTNLTAFGAFVDIGGFEGLVHISELSWSRVGHPRDVLAVGDAVRVFVLTVAPDEGRLALSLKRARANPWDSLDGRYRVGQIVSGAVTNVVDFGAFVKVEDDLEGMVHVSELADGSFLHPRNIVREGMIVRARVIAVDAQQHRLALSLRNIEIAEPARDIPLP